MNFRYLKHYFDVKREKFFSLIEAYYPEYRSQSEVFEQLANSNVELTDAVLDAGCGGNGTLFEAKRRAKIAVGIDSVRELKSNKSLSYVTIGNVEALPFKDNAFNLIICRYVIEHLKEPDKFFSEVNRVLDKKGKFVFMTPNLFGYRTLLSRMIPNYFHKYIIKFRDGREEDNVFRTYYRSNTVRALNAKLNNLGLRRENLIMFEGYPPLPFSLVLTRIMILYERMLNRFSILRTLRSVIIGVYVKNEGYKERSCTS